MPATNTDSVQLQSKLFRGFGDPARLGILQVLRSGPMTVTEIVSAVHMSQPNTSNHLRCLRECGLVSAQHDGKYVFYRLSDDRVGELLELGESLLAGVAHGIRECGRYNLRQSRKGGPSDIHAVD
jgi:DNA-binding transcriptional ArsR family regulator